VVAQQCPVARPVRACTNRAPNTSPKPGPEMFDVSRPALRAEYGNQASVGEAVPVLCLGEAPKGIGASEVS
jgi:hypothetical protein